MRSRCVIRTGCGVYYLEFIMARNDDQLSREGIEEHGLNKASIGSAFFPVPIDGIGDHELGVDLYLSHEHKTPVLYRAKGSSYSNADFVNLREQGITHFYIPNVQHCQFQEMLRNRIGEAIGDDKVNREERVRIVRDSCGKMIEDFTSNASLPGLSDTINEIAGQFSQWCASESTEFEYLYEMSEHDFYTTTHMVNVGVGCTLLASELLGAGHPQIQRITLGGLIHDVGKRGVDTEILNKEGKLSDEEWQQIRNHPQVGYEILCDQEGMDPLAIDMTLNHHERLDGKGYPNGISGDEISLPARICSVVDIYDALSSARPYRGPIPPCKVLEMMSEDVGSAIDSTVFEAWRRVLGRMLEADPERAVADKPGLKVPSMQSMLPSQQCQERPADGCVLLKRASGESFDLSVDSSVKCGEIGLVCDTKFTPGEQVQLRFEDGVSEKVSFVGFRFNAKGQGLAVFKLGKFSLHAA